MHPSALLRRAVPLAIIAMSIAAPSLAFSPTVTVVTGDPGDDIQATDLASRNGNVAVSMDVEYGVKDSAALAWSTDQGTTWDLALLPDHLTRESQAAWCAGQPLMVYAEQQPDPGTQWLLWTFTRDPEAAISGYRRWTGSGVARKPDVACIANEHIAVTWFQKQTDGYTVKVKGKGINGDDPYSQSFDLGSGSMSRGLAIASSATRLYVAWFAGDSLKVRRFSIGSGSTHSLSSLGTTTVASLPNSNSPQIGTDGDRVVLAYMHRADLKVRKSTNKGVSFGSPRTLSDKPFPSEVGARPTTVAVKGSKVAIGAVEFSELSGTGVGFLSTNGGSSYTGNRHTLEAASSRA